MKEMKPRVGAWKKAPTKRKPATKRKPTRTKKKASGISELLGIVEKSSSSKKKKKEAPLVMLEGRAEMLLELQQVQAAEVKAKGRKEALQGELFPEIEALRLALNQEKGKYFGTVRVQCKGGSVDAGQATYTIKNMYSAFDPTECSPDQELQEEYGGDASLRDEAAAAIAKALNVDEEEAEEMLDSRLEVSSGFALKPASLKDPKVIQILKMHLSEHLISKTRAKPTEEFHFESSTDPTEYAIMEVLNNIGLCKRYKATIRPSGAPKAVGSA